MFWSAKDMQNEEIWQRKYKIHNLHTLDVTTYITSVVFNLYSNGSL